MVNCAETSIIAWAAPSPCPSSEGVRVDFVQSPGHSALSTVEHVRTTAQVPIEFG